MGANVRFIRRGVCPHTAERSPRGKRIVYEFGSFMQVKLVIEPPSIRLNRFGAQMEAFGELSVNTRLIVVTSPFHS